jgi:deoxyribodipyrimidine photo-lyase
MIKILKEAETRSRGPVVYRMSRDCRTADNRALEYAARLARDRKSGVLVCFCLAGSFLGAPLRAFDFLVGGLRDVEAGLAELGVPFFLLEGDPSETLPAFLREIDASLLVTDFDPLRPKRAWNIAVAERISIPFHEVDAHNIVPCREVSNKREFAARTLRPKIMRLLPGRLAEDPLAERRDISRAGKEARRAGLEARSADWDGALGRLNADPAVPPVTWARPGDREGKRTLDEFLQHRLARYAEDRNDPNKEALSNLSPYLHFGQISPRAVARAVLASDAPPESRDAFIDEVVVRRELSDNFCFYNPAYDSADGFPDWARKSLDRHRKDPRPYLYSYRELDEARTHEGLWNAAQNRMARTGKMHGYLRMYWAKKILEWSPSPEEALATAIRLNDRYSLDGRDPNGYTGCAWSIGGVHDRPWFDRPVFGQVRYMNAAGAGRKFDTAMFIAKWADPDEIDVSKPRGA